MTELSGLHPSLQAQVVALVAGATKEQPAFMRRVTGFLGLPDAVRFGVVRRMHDGGWETDVSGEDLVVTGWMAGGREEK